MTESGEPVDMTDLTRVTSVTEDGPQLIVKPSAVSEADEAVREVVFSTTDLGVYYGAFRAVRDINLPILKNEITALIGPSGCGKTTFLRPLTSARPRRSRIAPNRISGSRVGCASATQSPPAAVSPQELRQEQPPASVNRAPLRRVTLVLGFPDLALVPMTAS